MVDPESNVVVVELWQDTDGTFLNYVSSRMTYEQATSLVRSNKENINYLIFDNRNIRFVSSYFRKANEEEMKNPSYNERRLTRMLTS